MHFRKSRAKLPILAEIIDAVSNGFTAKCRQLKNSEPRTRAVRNGLRVPSASAQLQFSGSASHQARFNTVDGCATNGVANEVMKAIFAECRDLVCVSHTSNLPMKLFEKATPTAHNFLQAWSQCLTQGSKVRAATRRALGEGGMKNHAIRWMAEFRTAVQVNDRFDLIREIIENQDVGCDNLMKTVRGILDRPAGNHLPSGEDALRLELALIKDAGEPIAHFCNHFEGDGFLASYAFDSWNNLNHHMGNVVHRHRG